MSGSDSPLASSLKLPCGLVLPNRFAKAATSEKLARRLAPSPQLVRLYERWGAGGAGALITGNVIVDPTAREGRGNVVVEDDRDLATLTEWAAEAQKHGSKLFMQVSHAGRQTPRSISPRPVAPSPVGLEGVGGLAARPRALEEIEIERIIDRFVRTSVVAERAGFAGVQLHGAHGYLIAQFLSPHSNRRTDRWGGSLDNRMRFLLRIVERVRGAVGSGFAVGVKLNSADFQRGGFDEGDSMVVAEALDAAGIDFLEVSGGNYESTAMFDGPGRDSTKRREAYFLDYVEKVRSRVRGPLMLTGGFRTRDGMAAALTGGAVDIVGLARPLIVEPDLPRRMLSGESTEAVDVDVDSRWRLLRGLYQATWYGRHIRRMGAGKVPRPTMGKLVPLILEGVPAYAFNPFAGLLSGRQKQVAELPTMEARA